MSASGGLSREEFLVLQEQLIALRNRNYELQEALQKKTNEVSQLSSPRSEALQFANKLINRREGNKEKEIAQKYEAELDALRMKLTSQEEEFRLQQETLITELNKIVFQNEALNKELEQFKADGSIYSSPQAGRYRMLAVKSPGKIEQLCKPNSPGRDARGVERTPCKRSSEINSLLSQSATPLKVQEAHDSELKTMTRNHRLHLRAKIAALEESDSKLSDDKLLLLETRYQLVRPQELADREKAFKSEKEEMQRKMCSLESSLSAKDEEKALALKKQAALIKELQRAVKEEKKRAESMEKLGRCCSEERGWHLVGESGAKSAQLNALENENARLNSEISEKSELIEHWIRRRPLAQGAGVTTPSKTEEISQTMLEIDDTPGGAGSVESSLLDHSMNSSNVPVNQPSLLTETDVKTTWTLLQSITHGNKYS
ncbi:hypothetical protein OSTOST_03807 [Ostertagia ostertagi]